MKETVILFGFDDDEDVEVLDRGVECIACHRRYTENLSVEEQDRWLLLTGSDTEVYACCSEHMGVYFL